MNESGLWRFLRTKLKGYWEPVRIENLVGIGTPDVYYTLTNGTMGWLELKHVDNWPKRQSTVIKIDHFTSEQRNWIRRHGQLGANVFLLLRVEKDYLLFDHEGCEYVGRETRAGLLSKCVQFWITRLRVDEFVTYLEKR